MERHVEVSTGESVAITYELAGLGSRFFAVFIDMAIQFTVAVVALLLLAWLGSALPNGASGAKTGVAHDFDKVGTAIVVAVLVFASFLLFFGYFILFEWRFEGRTPGKRLLGIRVVRDGGFPLDFTAAMVRNVVRILEVALGFYAISAVCMLLSPLNRRLGDLAAGTIVVREGRFERAHAAPSRATLISRSDDGHDLTDPQRELIRRYVDRRAGLSATARASVAAQIAAGVRPNLAASFEFLSDDDLLVHLAETSTSS
jgi:uncharacterized RDD family membrane protein YckC